MGEFTLSRDEVRELDRRAIDGFGVPGVVLMENAGPGRAEWVVAALVGTGLSRAPGAPFVWLVETVNASGKPVLAVDIPSGLDCDTGEPLGPTVKAAHTATFVAPKRGFLNPNAKEWTG